MVIADQARAGLDILTTGDYHLDEDDTCWGNPNMQKVFSDESYENSIEIYLDRLKGDVWTIEATENDFKELGLPERYVPAADEKLAWDQLPDQEPFTHLKPLR